MSRLSPFAGVVGFVICAVSCRIVPPSEGADSGAPDAGADADAAKSYCGRAAGSKATLPEMGLVQGMPCVHNRQCESGTFCEDPTFVCTPGVAGRGKSGITSCKSGNDCESGICVEATGGSYVCSDACDCKDDCSGSLTRCVQVPFLGIGVCARA